MGCDNLRWLGETLLKVLYLTSSLIMRVGAVILVLALC
jgi:hypothetical protein